MRNNLFIIIVHNLLKHNVSERYFGEIIKWVDDADRGSDPWNKTVVDCLADREIEIVGCKRGDGPVFRLSDQVIISGVPLGSPGRFRDC